MTSKKKPKSENLEDSQKRFAKDIGYKTGMTPESIEKGVEELISRSQPPYKEHSPPYGSCSCYEKFLEIAQTRRFDVVDPEFIRINVIGSRHEYKLIRGLRFLGLVDDEFRATQKLDSLRVIGDVFKERLDRVVRDAYKELFSKIVIQKATVETLVNFFMQRYNFGEGTARQASVIFIMLCKKAGIKLTPELETGSVSMRARTTSTKRASRRIPKSVKQDQPSRVPFGLTELRMGDITILLPKNDLSAALKARRLLDLHIEGLENSNSHKQ